MRLCADKLGSMKTLVRWRWRVHQEFTGKVYTTRHHMTEADALATDPQAIRVELSREEITCLTHRPNSTRPCIGCGLVHER
jgi:hypothetical protein